MENDTTFLYDAYFAIMGFLLSFAIFLFLVRSVLVWVLKKFWRQHIYFAANLFSWLLLGIILGAVRDVTNLRYLLMGLGVCAFPEMIILIYDCLRLSKAKNEPLPEK